MSNESSVGPDLNFSFPLSFLISISLPVGGHERFPKRYNTWGRVSGSFFNNGLQKSVAKKFANFLHLT